MGPFQFPDFDPVAIHIGPLAIRWYALAYVVALLAGWRYCMRLAKRPPQLVTPLQVDDFLVWATLGVILGGRLGFVLFYQPGYFVANPLEIVKIWKGGMSFHGGLLGVLLAMLVYARRQGIMLLALADLVTAATPIGLFLGRIANFVNGELWGRTTDVPWGVIFPRASSEPRHPSQLYEAGLEGIVLFVVLAALIFSPVQALRRPGLVSGVFLAGYGAARVFVEFFRQPDPFLGSGGFLAFGTTWGQWLSLPLVIGGIYLIARAFRRAPEYGA